MARWEEMELDVVKDGWQRRLLQMFFCAEMRQQGTEGTN
jgi:hypothetical protein